MATLREYWRRLSSSGRIEYARRVGTTVRHVENKNICKDPLRRQTPKLERQQRFIRESNGEVTAEGIAFDFVIEPLTALQQKDKTLAENEG